MSRRIVITIYLVVTPVMVMRGLMTAAEPYRWLSVVLAVLWMAFTIESAIIMTKNPSLFRRLRMPAAWLLSALALAPNGSSDKRPSNATTAQSPFQFLSPALAGMVLARIIDIRRHQLISRQRPARLQERDLDTLHVIRRSSVQECDASINGTGDAGLASEALSTDVRELIVAVSSIQEMVEHVPSSPSWKVMVCVLGSPMVIDHQGRHAVFRKGRSLELLCWLVLNKDRMRRSTARTAMWDVDVSDATFSTIVSDMRRGLCDLMVDFAREDVCATTYNDEIILHPEIVTDLDVFEAAFRKFSVGPSPDELVVEEMLSALRLVRDIPFSGRPFGWADLDGSTTRIVISVLEAAHAVAEWGMAKQRSDVVRTAVRAGLRIMPGDVGLLDVQRQAIGIVTTCSAEKSLT